MLADFHIHSNRSDDCETPIEVQLGRALQLSDECGLREICFTDHVDFITEEVNGRTEYIPLSDPDYSHFTDEVKTLQQHCGDKLTLRTGAEYGVQICTIPFYARRYADFGKDLDFVLMSVHQIANHQLWNREFLQFGEQAEYNRRYFQEMLGIVKNYDGYDVLAHVDLIRRYDPAGVYETKYIREYLEEIFSIVIAKGKGIEINTSSWHYELSDTTPARDILKLYYDMGGRIITTGSDAHEPEYITDHFRDANTILYETGFREFYTYEHHIPVPHPIEV